MTAGPQWVGNRLGGEVSLLRVTFDRHVGGGGGLVTGADAQFVYGEIEGVLIVTPHDERTASMGHEYPWWYLTGGLGVVARWDDRPPGLQATLSSTVVLLPLTLVARLLRFPGENQLHLHGGLMLKLPVWEWW